MIGITKSSFVVQNQRALLKECIDGEWQFVRVILETEEDGDHLRKSLAEEDFVRLSSYNRPLTIV